MLGVEKKLEQCEIDNLFRNLRFKGGQQFDLRMLLTEYKVGKKSPYYHGSQKMWRDVFLPLVLFSFVTPLSDETSFEGSDLSANFI